jgi:murein DD-endopeptidase MepM/ murein hydrolase activator NlpD
MSSKKSEISTVLFVSKDGRETKSLKIKTKHLKGLKYYIALLGFVLIALSTTIIILSRNLGQYDEERLVLNEKISILERQIPKASDSLTAKSYVENIEMKLKKINEYLTKRGIKGFSNEGVGGNNQSTKLSPSETYAFYDQQIKTILNGIAYTPMGYAASPLISSIFGFRSDPFSSGRPEFHSGIDFKGKRGDIVKSTAAGQVIFAGWYQGYGKCIRLKHKNGYETLYGHLSKIGVRKGQTIAVGQVIGNMGSTGRSTGIHLHYEVRKNGKAINPSKFLRIN